MKFSLRILICATSAGMVMAAYGCNNNTTTQNDTNQTLFAKYGGTPTIQKVVDDAVTALIADCTQNPYFTNAINFDNVQTDSNGHGSNGHDTADRLKSCLDAQFTAVFGGPSTYNGSSTASGIPSRTIPGQVYDCEDMTTAHNDIGIPAAVFDRFVSDLGVVLVKDGVSSADASTVATALVGFKTPIVAPSSSQVIYNYQPGDPANQPAVACSVGPSPSPSPSPVASPSPSPSPSPVPSPSASGTL